jgi:hypothetical protein
MNRQMKTFLIIMASIFIGGASFTYGAMTAPQPVAVKPSVSPQSKPTPKPTKSQLEQQLVTELPIVTNILVTAYPKIATDYTISKSQLFDRGQWFGVVLSYHGADTANRDTLRVLLQKKNGVWKLRTTPPRPLLSSKQLPDVSKNILKTINEPVSLP